MAANETSAKILQSLKNNQTLFRDYLEKEFWNHFDDSAHDQVPKIAEKLFLYDPNNNLFSKNSLNTASESSKPENNILKL